MKTRTLIIIGIITIIVISTIVVGFFTLSSNDNKYSKENPYGFSAHMFYSKDFLPLMCPTQNDCITHLQLNIWSDVPAILQGYKICNGFYCVTKDNIHFSTDSAIIPIFDGNKWNVGDKVSIKVQVVTQYDEKYTHHPPPIPFYIDLGEFEITEYGQILSTDTQCNGELLSPRNYETGIIPVLLMQPNSTAIVCVTYNFPYDWASYPNKDVYSDGIFHFNRFNINSEHFQITANPIEIDAHAITAGTNVTVMYKIHADLNSKGFYNTSVPYGFCSNYPLAVGYDASQINASDFSDVLLLSNHSCFNDLSGDKYAKIVSGMNYVEIDFNPDS